MKSKNENLTLFSFTKVENIMPAKAPIGVKNAPMLLPIIEAYTPCRYDASGRVDTRLVNNMLIGILLIRLLAKNDE